LPSPEAIFLHQNTPNPSPGHRTRLHRTIVSQAYIWEWRKARKGETDGRERVEEERGVGTTVREE